MFSQGWNTMTINLLPTCSATASQWFKVLDCNKLLVLLIYVWDFLPASNRAYDLVWVESGFRFLDNVASGCSSGDYAVAGVFVAFE